MLPHNFGHQAAITAGLEALRRPSRHRDGRRSAAPAGADPADDCRLARGGYQVVYTIRQDTHKDRLVGAHLWTSGAFYRCINLISDTPIIPGASDFRLMDRIAVEAILVMPERSRFLRGMISWLGFRQVGLSYQVQTRLNGQSRILPFVAWRAWHCRASQKLLDTSVADLGGAGAHCGGHRDHPTEPGQSTRSALPMRRCPDGLPFVVAVLFLGGVQLMSIGVLGEYIGRIYTEVEARPNYLVNELIGFRSADQGKPPRQTAAAPIPTPHFPQVSCAPGEASHP